MTSRATLRWIAHAEMSAAHAANVVAIGARCVDPKTEQALVRSVTEVNNRLLSSSVDVSTFWTRYVQRTLTDQPLAAACSGALLDAGCSELQLEQTEKAIRSRLNDSRSALMSRYPKLAEQLELRARPLRDKWETYGPGLLRHVANQIWQDSPPLRWWPERIDVWLVQPLRGGDGGIAPTSDRIWIEAMLTDADPQVPEVLRIAWLVTRLAIEQHLRQEKSGDDLSLPWSLYSVPLILAAATDLELIRCQDLPITAAMQLWRFGNREQAERLGQWWQQQQASPVPLPVALKSLRNDVHRDP